ncbi:hypothetical protein E3N88_10441 [Mikania micrantha]|uniref:Uncharacterized protein n=1 Tax=Mikania micrantha TaxID=192012 RepID=A0A5N6PAM6_9ASTR|nr:hypothetical protein E3N88_10441 [Mikania micrantha]
MDPIVAIDLHIPLWDVFNGDTLSYVTVNSKLDRVFVTSKVYSLFVQLSVGRKGEATIGELKNSLKESQFALKMDQRKSKNLNKKKMVYYHDLFLGAQFGYCNCIKNKLIQKTTYYHPEGLEKGKLVQMLAGGK